MSEISEEDVKKRKAEAISTPDSALEVGCVCVCGGGIYDIGAILPAYRIEMLTG